jgi:valyl-tRNA synthetase
MITTQAGTEPVLTSAMPALLSSLPITHLRCLDMSEPMSAGYNPIAVEAAWYDWWHAQGFFKPEYIQPALQGQDLKDRETFVIPSPPPNVTGSLHIGHALTVAIQDGMVRWNRMLGRKTLFAPGFDHAGISTQSVVEKRLFKTEGKTRHDLGRERFVEKVMDWRNEYVYYLQK